VEVPIALLPRARSEPVPTIEPVENAGAAIIEQLDTLLSEIESGITRAGSHDWYKASTLEGSGVKERE
jgi:hypothetical protein